MVSKSNIFIHPGFVKTATSSLQQLAFSRHPEIQYLGLPERIADVRWAIKHICYADSIIYEEQKVSDVFNNALQSFDLERPILLSHEVFALHESKDKGLVARRLKTLFPEAKVFFTLRRQEEVLASFYLQKLPRYMRENSFVSFDRWLKDQAKSAHLSILDDLNYFHVVSYYAKLFGREGIRLFLFEDLRKNTMSYSRQIAEYIGVDPVAFQNLIERDKKNLTVSQEYIDFWNRWGPLLPHSLARKISKRVASKPGVPAKIDIGDSGREVVYRLCARGNRSLSKEFNVSLESNGYTVA
ncbi:MAG: hypothetical protein DRH06_05360 [Deltaproteobacteria bacterium]|nr:MAG: hypothetical protein DRH06_05360 [Deltaproteobacteria bacterium]